MNDLAARPKGIVAAASSTIGGAIARRWRAAGWDVVGTYRTASKDTDELVAEGVRLVPCDFAQRASVERAAAEVAAHASPWDALLLGPGTLAPIGPFEETAFDDWVRGLEINLIGPLRFLRALLPHRRQDKSPGPLVVLFAGSGSNGPAPNYSSYTLSKVALIKIAELLDSEQSDTRYVILGPGWVRARIHSETLAAGERAGEAYQRTLERLARNDFVPVEQVMACVQWALDSPKEVVGGRNFSVPHDPWGAPWLARRLAEDPDLHRLRRRSAMDSPRSPHAPAPEAEDVLDDVFVALGRLPDRVAPGGTLHRALGVTARAAVHALWSEQDASPRRFGPFGRIAFPYVRMGAIDSLDLFGLDELLLFRMYWDHRHHYRRALDLGANLGLHAIVMARCGWQVTAVEPDPEHLRLLRRNLEMNACDSVVVHEAAVSDRVGLEEFVRVLGNTTGSHLAGSKPNPYGPLERFPVRLLDVRELLAGADFAKVDVEGHERRLLLATRARDWQGVDAVVEVGSAEAAREIMGHFDKLGIPLYAQKIHWRRVRRPEDLPVSHREGSLFIGGRGEPPWSATLTAEVAR